MVELIKKINLRGAAIAQWIRLHLPSCCPGFESQAHHLCFFSIYKVQIVYLSLESECEKNENKQKEANNCPFLKKKINLHATNRVVFEQYFSSKKR